MAMTGDASHDGRAHQQRQPLKRETLADGAYEQIRGAILRGDFADGATLKQGELAKELAISTVPVREALRRLQAEQLLVGSPFLRYIVRSHSRDEITAYVDIRENLELFAVSRTISRLSEETEVDLSHAEALLAELSPDIDDESWFALDVAFHKALYREDLILADMIEDIRHRIHRYTQAESAPPARAAAAREHRDLLHAVTARDQAQAASIVRSHIGATRSQVLQRHG